ncbi:EamA family transporter, partial [Vibrio parahaemolyticus]|nr:EamA family transporter [Vibrio parahaemolyticus]
FTNLLFTAVWQSLFFEDRMSQSQIVGMSLIVLAIILNTCWVRFTAYRSGGLQARTS